MNVRWNGSRSLAMIAAAIVLAACGAKTHNPAGTIEASGTEIFVSETVSITARLERNAGSAGYTVPLLTSNAGVLQVPASVTIPPGADSVTVTGTGLSAGGPIVLTLRFPSGDATAEVLVLAAPTVLLTAVTGSADQLSTGSFVISGTASHARALDPAAVTVTAPAASGVTLGAPVLTGNASAFQLEIPYDVAVDAAPGPLTLDVDTNGSDLGATDTVDVEIRRIARIASITPSSRTIDTTQIYPMLVTLDQPARAQGEHVVFTSGNPANVVAPVMVTVSAGLLSANFDVEGVAVTGPVAVVGVLADSTSMAAVSVQDATISVPVVASGGFGYPGDAVAFTATGTGSSYVAVNGGAFTLTAPAGSGLVLSGASLAGTSTAWTLTATVTVSGGATPATVNLAFDANGATPGAARTIPFTIRPLPKVFSVGPDGTSVAVGSTATLTVTLDALAPVNESVSLSSNSGNVSVPATVTVAAGQTQATFAATGVAEGTATITASLNGGSDTTVVTAFLPQMGSVVFSEFRTFTTDTAARPGEIELVNVSGVAQTINAWTVETTTSGAMSIRLASAPSDVTVALVVPAGGRVAGVPNPASAASIPAGVDFVYGAPGTLAVISVAGDRVRLFEGAALQDQVDFRTGFVTNGATALGASDFPGAAKHSTQLAVSATSATANDDGGNWCTTFRARDTFGAANQSCSNVVINEVLYDSATADDGNTFAELAGNGGAVLGGMKIRAIDGAAGTINASVTIPTGRRMPADGFFVLADTLNGVTTVANADLLSATFDPQNGPDAIQLLSAAVSPTVLDAVTYGAGAAVTVASDGTSIVEGTACIDPPSGSSIVRDANSTDTNSNSVDFASDATPTPGLSNDS